MSKPGEPSFVVEFVGLPGAGKSTLSHAVAKALRASGEIVTELTYDITRGQDRRWRKLIFATRTLVRHPWLSVVGLGQVIISRQRTLRDLGLGAFNFLYICGLIESVARKPGIHLLDQGFFTALWTLSFSASGPMPLTSLMRVGQRCCGRLGLVVMIEVQPETVLARLRVRPGMDSRIEGRGGACFGAGLDAALSALEQIRTLLEAGQGAFRFEAVDEDAHRNQGRSQGWDQIEALAALIRQARSSEIDRRSAAPSKSSVPAMQPSSVEQD